MIQLFDTPHLNTWCDEESGIFYIVWKPSEDITDDIFRSDLAQAAEIFQRKCPDIKLILSDSSLLRLKKKPATELWSSEMSASILLKNKATKIAIVLPQHIFSAMSVMRSSAVLQEIGGHQFHIRNFANQTSAEKWLVQK